MKKLLLLMLSMLSVSAIVEEIHYASMRLEELALLYQEIGNELAWPTTIKSGKVFLQSEKISRQEPLNSHALNLALMKAEFSGKLYISMP